MRMEKYKKRLGDFGEEIAAGHLLRRGYAIRERNYRCTSGEIDLIAEKGQELIFLEVKTRTSDRFGTPAEAVDKRKQVHIQNCAEAYLLAHPWDGEIRFDVMEVYAGVEEDGFRLERLNHIERVVMEV